MKPIFFKRQLFCFFSLILFINCSKDDTVPPIPENAVFEPQTELISLTGGSNQLIVTWKPVVISNFVKYKVYRFNSFTDANISPSVIANIGELIFESNSNLTTAYVDSSVPFNSFIHYAVVTEYLNQDNIVLQMNSINYLSYENENLSFMVTSVEKLADGSIKLTWENDSNSGFENYSIAVVNDYNAFSSEFIFNTGSILNVNGNQNNTTIIDPNQYHKNKMFYAVSKTINGKTIFSKNFISIENPRILNFNPRQTLKNPYNEDEMIIINSNGSVVFYNIESLDRIEILTNGENFFSSIGAYNGVYDLYVPSANGKIFVIDLVAHTLKEIMNINSDSDYNIISAISIDDHILFLEKHRFADIGGMFVYDRVNHVVINRDGIYTMNTNSKLIFAKDNYFFSVWKDGLDYGSDSAIRRLNINGNTVTIDLLFNSSITDSRLFALAEDKSYFVSTNLGYQSNLDYPNFTETTTQKYSQNQFFGDAKIFGNNQIYFSLPNELRIDVFEKNNFTSTINQYATIGSPLFIEVFTNNIISLNQFENNYFVQTIPK